MYGYIYVDEFILSTLSRVLRTVLRTASTSLKGADGRGRRSLYQGRVGGVGTVGGQGTSSHQPTLVMKKYMLTLQPGAAVCWVYGLSQVIGTNEDCRDVGVAPR